MIEKKQILNKATFENKMVKILTQELYHFYNKNHNQAFSQKDSPLTYKLKSNKAKTQAKKIIEDTYAEIIDYIIPKYDKTTQLLSHEQAQDIIFCMTNIFIESNFVAKKNNELSERLPVLIQFIEKEKKEYTMRIKERAKLLGK